MAMLLQSYVEKLLNSYSAPQNESGILRRAFLSVCPRHNNHKLKKSDGLVKK